MSRRLSLSVLLALLALAAAARRGPGRLVPGRARGRPVARHRGARRRRPRARRHRRRSSTSSASTAASRTSSSSRFNGGEFRPPERVDTGIGAGRDRGGDRAWPTRAGSRSCGPRAAASTARVVRRQRPAAGAAARPDRALQRSRRRRPRDVAIDMGINGTAYASCAAPGRRRRRTSASRACRTPTWTPVGAPLDIDPAQAAGRGAQRSRVGVSAEGNAVVTWGENHADGRRRVYGRRVTGLTPSVVAAGALARRTSTGRPAAPPTRPTSTSRTTARSRGPSSARTSAAARARSRGGWSARCSTRPCRSTAGRAPPPRIGDQRSRRRASSTVAGGGGEPARPTTTSSSRSQLLQLAAPRAQRAEPPPASSRALARSIADLAGRRRRASARAALKPDDEARSSPRRRCRVPTSGRSPRRQRDRRRPRGAASPSRSCRARRRRRSRSRVHDRPPGRPGAIARSRGRAPPAEARWRSGVELWGPQRFRVVVDGGRRGDDGTSLVPPRPAPPGAAPLPGDRDRPRGQETPSRTRRRALRRQPRRGHDPGRGRRERGPRAAGRRQRGRRQGSGVRSIRVDYGDSRRVATARQRFRGAPPLPARPLHGCA